MIMIMIGAMAANSSSSPCFLLSAEMKCSIGMKKLKSMNSNYSYSNSNLNTSFLDDEWYTRMICLSFRNHQQKRLRKSVVNELGGQYEEVFNDVKLELRNCFTAKAVRTVLYQLYEMNPPQYIWLHNFIAENDPADGKRFLRNLAKENQDLAERVMITRLHLYGKWIKQCDHAEIYKEISDENLELMRERLLETIIWPAADDNKTEHVSRLSCIKSPFSTPPGKGNILAAIKMAVEEPILCRLDRLHNIVRKLEEIRGESSCASTPSSGTLTSDGGQVSSLDFSPRSLEKHCRPINDVMLETEVKGTLLQRLLHVEDRVAKLCMQMEEETETEKRRIEQQQEEKNKMSKKKKKSGLRQLVTSCVTGNNLKQT